MSSTASRHQKHYNTRQFDHEIKLPFPTQYTETPNLILKTSFTFCYVRLFRPHTSDTLWNALPCWWPWQGLTSLSSGRTTLTTPLLGSTRRRSVPLRPNMTGPPSGSEPLSVYTAAPTGVLSLTTCRFMSAVNEGGRLAVTPGRQTNNMFLVVTKSELWICYVTVMQCSVSRWK